MAIKGIGFLPVSVKKDQALELYKILANLNKKLGKLSSEVSHSIVNENFIQVFSLIESTQSTRIEGTQVTFTEVLEEINTKKKSSEIIEVENYQNALSEGIKLLKEGEPISTRLIKRLHKILMVNSRGTISGSGEFRKIQNHIGPDNKIENAVYIPIPANDIHDYMSNLDNYINGAKHYTFRDDFSSDQEVFDENAPEIIKAAIIHAQFESIHPFLDGNGRLGRILILLFLLKEDVIDQPVFFVSEELERERARYYDLLNGVRGEKADWYPWLKFFLSASERMADSLLTKVRECEMLARQGMASLKLDSERRVWLYSFNMPVFTVAQASKDIGLTQQTVRTALKKLVDLELVYTDKVTIKNKKYNNYEVIRILNQR
ncbi:Fic family protein [Lactococcus lactis]|uniref:Fic family protein n=1 Tax=Lactococcus lactis TaxID=1358 RepID=UPI00288DFE33|nr:Fic family protein [Lactococcus lactis]MDT2859664.1 Fic family protein [Lactococcus lactis]MDT2917285.1 Fic family protein [Lactococcus lactis]